MHTNAAVCVEPVPAGLRELLERAVQADPTDGEVAAALGNVLVRESRFSDGLKAYKRAHEASPQRADIELGYAERLRLCENSPLAPPHLRAALARSLTYHEPARSAGARPLALLLAPGFWERNAPLDLLIDRETFAVTKLYLEGDDLPELESGALLVNGIADPTAAHSIRVAERLARTTRCINHPTLIAHTERTYLSRVAAQLRNTIVPPTEHISADALRSDPVDVPLVVRPARDGHRGEGFARVRDARELREYIEQNPSAAYYRAPFVDYRSADGYYRKYRIIIVRKNAYPFHLAISDQWMVHYFSALNSTSDWMRAEEERFIADFSAVFSPALQAALDDLGEVIGLDYFGVDCALVDDRLLIFEANANMLVHQGAPEAFEAIARAFSGLFA